MQVTPGGGLFVLSMLPAFGAHVWKVPCSGGERGAGCGVQGGGGGGGAGRKCVKKRNKLAGEERLT